MENNLIYGLYCPFLETLHYIGKSTSNMVRPMQHLNESHSEKINEWVTQLKQLGYKPIVKILEICIKDNLDDREKFWIKNSIENDCFLLNIAHNTSKKLLTQNEYIFNDCDILTMCNLIKKERKNLKLSQTELSQMAKIDRTTLFNIEKGNKQITLKNLKKSIRYFRI